MAALFYTMLAWGQPQPLLYKIAHGLKVVGGMVGWWVVAAPKTGVASDRVPFVGSRRSPEGQLIDTQLLTTNVRRCGRMIRFQEVR